MSTTHLDHPASPYGRDGRFYGGLDIAGLIVAVIMALGPLTAYALGL